MWCTILGMEEIYSKLYDAATANVLKEYKDTTIETVEKYLSKISNTKVLFKIPYENNKTILCIKDNYIYDYYSKDKQELIKKIIPKSTNMGMLKQSLITRFSNLNYNKWILEVSAIMSNSKVKHQNNNKSCKIYGK